MINDPFELMLGVKPPQQPEPEDPADERRKLFHSQIRYHPDDTGYQHNLATDICRFDERGQHVQMAKNCPHYAQQDEEGPRIQQGWTVQS